MIERSDDGDVAVLRLAHGPVNALDAELCETGGWQGRRRRPGVVEGGGGAVPGAARRAGARRRRHRDWAGADEADPVIDLWIRRATDGWTARYLDGVTGRK